MSFKGKVIIVGAGAAGITAGHLLNEADIDFEILEASSTHGGRLKKTDELADFPLDMGGEWVHTYVFRPKPAILRKILAGNDPKFETIPWSPKTVSVWSNGKLYNRNIFHWLLHGTNSKFKNTTWFDVFDEVAGPFTEKILYNQPVKKIDYSGKKVVVTNKEGKEYECDKILVTVPVKMLQQGYIDFTPSLPRENEKEIRAEVMGDGVKLFIEFSETFYPDVLLFESMFSLLEMDHLYYNASLGKSSEKSVMGAVAIGEKAKKYLSAETEEDMVKMVIDELDLMFEGKASLHYMGHVVQNWTAEPFIQGSYSNYGASSKKMAKPVDGKVYFAGEAMSLAGNTTVVHGASEAAYAALEEMLKIKK